MSARNELNQQIVACQKCPRLILHCQKVARDKRKAYAEQDYWGKPVPNFGNLRVPLLIVGLAPGAHGADRTGRMFTGDRSGDWLYSALFKAGFCNQPESYSMDDGLKLKRCTITAVCHCAPPDNKPSTAEVTNCAGYLEETIRLGRPKVMLALGGIAWKAVVKHAISQEWYQPPQPKFSHGAKVELMVSGRGRRTGRIVPLIGCYHPSQQNTFTGRLTEKMLDELMDDVRELAQ